MYNDELEKMRCAIAHKAYKLLPEDYCPLLWLYKEQRELEIRIELYEKHGADKEFLDELRREYRIARRRYLLAVREQEALDKDTEDTLESVRPPFC